MVVVVMRRGDEGVAFEAQLHPFTFPSLGGVASHREQGDHDDRMKDRAMKQRSRIPVNE